jgi:CheY-like chemotaxis protein
VVDDEPPMRRMLAIMLEFGGYEVETAVDGDDALFKFRREPFDVVLTDHSMPKMNGLELGRACKTLAPHVPIILLTGWLTKLTPQQLDDWGICLALAKPISSEALLAAVDGARERGPTTPS